MNNLDNINTKPFPFILLFFIFSISANCQDNEKYEMTNLPQYRGELKAFYEYVKKNLIYPSNARKNNINGKVWVEFYVNSDGSIDKNAVNVIKGIDSECDQEAIRVVTESKGWTPGKRDGKASREKLVLYIPFIIETKQTNQRK